MKLVWLFVIFTMCPFLCWADYQFGTKPPEYSNGKMLRTTQNALMQYELIQTKSEYWGRRLEKMLLGTYAEKLIFVAPLITGKVEFNALDMNFYFDARNEKSGVRYVYKF